MITRLSCDLAYTYFLLGYELERQQSPGIPVDLTSSLETQGTLDFVLVKNVGEYTLCKL